MKRLECLDGLRGLLAVYVLLGHMAPFALLPDALQSAVSHGGAAVDLFFVLSGLVITQSLQNAGGRAAPFLLIRVTRIFPVFLVVFALAVVVQPCSCGFESMPWIGPDNAARTICVMAWPHAWLPEVLAHLAMVHGLFPNGVLKDVWVSFLGAAWSLSTEWQFYLIALLAVGPSRRLCWLLLGLAAAGLAWHQSAPDAWQFSRAFLPTKGHFFALGVASVGLVRGANGALRHYAVVLAATIAVCATQGSLGKILPPLAWTFCLLVQMRPDTPGLAWVARLLRSSVTAYLGAISYCLYLVNEPIHKLASAILSRVAHGDAVLFSVLWVPLAIGLPILAASWLHTHLEAPVMRWGRVVAGRSATGPRGPSVQVHGRAL